jgi:hypothetical protein
MPLRFKAYLELLLAYQAIGKINLYANRKYMQKISPLVAFQKPPLMFDGRRGRRRRRFDRIRATLDTAN